MNTRHKQVALRVFSGENQSQAYEAVYGKNPNSRFLASQLLTSPNMKAYLNDLNRRREAVVLANVTHSSIATPDERKERLTEILRADLTDFQDGEGHPKLDKDVPNHRAAREHYHRVKYDKFGNPIITKNIKLTDPIEAIRELNRMDGSYAPSKHMIAQRVTFEIEQVDKRKRGED